MTNEELQDFKNSVGQGEPLSLFQQATLLEENERLQKELENAGEYFRREWNNASRYRKTLEEAKTYIHNIVQAHEISEFLNHSQIITDGNKIFEDINKTLKGE